MSTTIPKQSYVPDGGWELHGKWRAVKFECQKCAFIQVSVCPAPCRHLECQICHHMNPISRHDFPAEQ